MLLYVLAIFCLLTLLPTTKCASINITNQSTFIVEADECMEKLQNAGMLENCHDEVKRRWKVSLPPFPWEIIKKGNDSPVKEGDTEEVRYVKMFLDYYLST